MIVVNMYTPLMETKMSNKNFYLQKKSLLVQEGKMLQIKTHLCMDVIHMSSKTKLSHMYCTVEQKVLTVFEEAK